jgi:hypothetical protein
MILLACELDVFRRLDINDPVELFAMLTPLLASKRIVPELSTKTLAAAAFILNPE